MNSQAELDILEETVQFYLGSKDFNGIPVRVLFKSAGMGEAEFNNTLAKLVEDGAVDLVFGNQHPNPHIRAFKPPAQENQVEYLRELGWTQACAYPSAEHLSRVVDDGYFLDKPFSRRVALGAAQLDFAAFDISVLEQYRNDPRYTYRTHDRGGVISISDSYFEDTQMPERDKVLLQSFGFGFDKKNERVVIAFFCYLAKLTAEHQAIWNAKVLNGEYGMHPDYYRSSILGEFPESLSLFEAFLLELKEINALCTLIEKPPLFREEYSGDRPDGFGWMVRPTLNEFGSFALLLDKMLSENINKAFFEEDIPLETEHLREDGKIEVRRPGTVKLLESWMDAKFVPKDPAPMKKMISTLRSIRKMRQKPAHSVREDKFNKDFFEKQRVLMSDAYEALRTIRQVLQNHPYAAGHIVREDLSVGKICQF